MIRFRDEFVVYEIGAGMDALLYVPLICGR